MAAASVKEENKMIKDPYTDSGSSPPSVGKNTFPPLAPDDYAALRTSIERYGVLVPIVVGSTGNVIDGIHRLTIARELGVPYRVVVVYTGRQDFWVDNANGGRYYATCISPRLNKSLVGALVTLDGVTDWVKRSTPVIAIKVKPGYDPDDIARDLNLARRHLTVEQRREFTTELRAKGASTRAIAKATGVSQRTVVTDIKKGKQVSTPTHLTPDDRGFNEGDRVWVSYRTSPDDKKSQRFSGTVVSSTRPGCLVHVQPDNKQAEMLTLDAESVERIEEPPAKVTGIDGKSYPAKPKAPAAKPKKVDEAVGPMTSAEDATKALANIRRYTRDPKKNTAVSETYKRLRNLPAVAADIRSLPEWWVDISDEARAAALVILHSTKRDLDDTIAKLEAPAVVEMAEKVLAS